MREKFGRQMKKAEFTFENDDVTRPPNPQGFGGSRTCSEAAVLTHLDLENNCKSPPFEITLIFAVIAHFLEAQSHKQQPDPTTRYDLNNNGYLSAPELRHLLEDLDFYVDDVRAAPSVMTFCSRPHIHTQTHTHTHTCTCTSTYFTHTRTHTHTHTCTCTILTPTRMLQVSLSAVLRRVDLNGDGQVIYISMYYNFYVFVFYI